LRILLTELYKVNLNGTQSLFKEANMYVRVKLFAWWKLYHDQYYRKTIFLYRSVKSFSFKTIVVWYRGKEIKVVNEVALKTKSQKGFMATQEKKYGMAKRPKLHIYYVEALDEEIQKTK
jgi:hypothetical protein